MVLSYKLFKNILYHEQTIQDTLKCLIHQVLEDTAELLIVLQTGVINDSVKTGEKTTLSFRALNMKYHEVPHFTFKWFNHDEHVHKHVPMCVIEKNQNKRVSQLRMLSALGLEGMDIHCSSLYNCIMWIMSHGRTDQSILATRTVVCQGCYYHH